MSSKGIRVLVIGMGRGQLDDLESCTPLSVTTASPGAARSWLARPGRRGDRDPGAQFDCVVCSASELSSEVCDLLRDLDPTHPARPVVAVGPSPSNLEEASIDAVIPPAQIGTRLQQLVGERTAASTRAQSEPVAATTAGPELATGRPDATAAPADQRPNGGMADRDATGTPTAQRAVPTDEASSGGDPGANEAPPLDTSRIFDRVTDAIFAVDEDFRFTFFNERAISVLGVEPGEATGKSLWNRFPRILDTDIEAAFRRAMRTKESETFTHQFQPENKAFEIRLFPSDTGISVYFRDITTEIARQRKLEHLARLHRVIRGVNEALGPAASRAEIESVVCNRLVEDEAVEFAWIGRQQEGSIEPAAYAGDLRFAKAIEGCRACCQQDIADRALGSNDVVVSDSEEKEPGVPALQRLTDTTAAIPLSDGERCHGVLCLHLDTSESFIEADETSQALRQLRDAVGLAITAARCRAALVSDSNVEVEFTVADGGDSMIGVTGRFDVTVDVKSVQLREDGRFDTTVLTRGPDRDRFVRAITEMSGVYVVDADDSGDKVRIRVGPEVNTIVSTLADHGGRIEHLNVEGGVATATGRIPGRSDVSVLFDDLEDSFDEVTLKAKRDADQHQVGSSPHLSDLTARQREALTRAYRMGYFAWPRDAAAEDVADTMELSSATFHEHLRTAERKIFDSLLSG